ncbi:MAG TPA: hypothetical protein VN326_19235 [Casimicrobiaceae bacterium]|jgi:hypothetical protein|nr:hypothetical protein [Casimicrobiaceae bacterium]
MDIVNWKSWLLGMALCMSGTALAQTPNTSPRAGPAVAPRSAPYDCFGMDGVALRSCMDLNAAAAYAGNNTTSASHDCGGMTGDALATCRELNGEILAPPVNSYNPGGWYGTYGAPGYVPPGNNPPPAGNPNPASGSGSSSGSNPTGLSPGSGITGSSSGSDPTGLSGGSGKSPSSNTTAQRTSSNTNSSARGKSGM